MIKRLCILCTLILAMTSCSTTTSSNKSSSTQKGKASYLFVILSNYGKIQQAPDGSWQLILNHGDVEKVLAFSDRPYRLVEHMTGKDLQTIWTQGSNSFADDPPNATVIINQHLQTVILESMTVENDLTIFKIQADGEQSLVEMDGETQVFVDMSAADYRLWEDTGGL